MSEERKTTTTAYGLVDEPTLRELQDTYDTTVLLRMVDELDAILAEAREEDGLRDLLLRLHGMTHTVLNGAGMSVPTGEDTLPEVAFDVGAEIQRIMAVLRNWQTRVELLERLTPRD